MIRIQLYEDRGLGRRYGHVLDANGNVIGDASDYIYGGSAFAVHTREFAGWVPVRQIELLAVVEVAS